MSKSVVKPGDQVALRRSHAGAAEGLYLVLEVVEDRITVQAFADKQIWSAPAAEIDADIVSHYATLRPATGPVTLAPRPAPQVAVVPPEPPAPQELRLFRLVRPRPDYRFDHPAPGRGKSTTNHYVTARDAIDTGVDHIGQRFVDMPMEAREGLALRAEWGDEAVQDRGPWPSPSEGAA